MFVKDSWVSNFEENEIDWLGNILLPIPKILQLLLLIIQTYFSITSPTITFPHSVAYNFLLTASISAA
jgi:hypothetical protein